MELFESAAMLFVVLIACELLCMWLDHQSRKMQVGILYMDAKLGR